MTRIILGTRGSDLALAQTRIVSEQLSAAHPDLEVDIRIIKTTGDKRLDVSLSAPGTLDKGLFTKELEDALLAGEVDIAVHSLKDLPTQQPGGLVVGAILERADSSDVLITKSPGGLDAVPLGARVATSSLRRKNQLLHVRPDLDIHEIRGNVPTRLQKLAEHDKLSGLLLAKAGLDRLGPDIMPEGLYVFVLSDMLPAPGQGAIGIECREDDQGTLEILAAIHHEDTARCVKAERDLLSRLGGGCHMPLGAKAWIENGEVHLKAALYEAGKIKVLSEGVINL